jgi:hypothetical protein
MRQELLPFLAPVITFGVVSGMMAGTMLIWTLE